LESSGLDGRIIGTFLRKWQRRAGEKDPFGSLLSEGKKVSKRQVSDEAERRRSRRRSAKVEKVAAMDVNLEI